jgi:DNA-binding LytR/AlgR family response regulator
MIQDFFFLRVNRKYVRLDIASLVYIEAKGTYTKLFLNNGTSLLAHTKLKDWERLLPPTLFLRINKSYILNLSKVSGFNVELAWIGDKAFKVARDRRQALTHHQSVIVDAPAMQPVDRNTIETMSSELQLN